MTHIYMLHCVTFSSDIYGESHIETKFAFVSESDAETYILENDLLSRYESIDVVKVPIKLANSVSI